MTSFTVPLRVVRAALPQRVDGSKSLQRAREAIAAGDASPRRSIDKASVISEGRLRADVLAVVPPKAA